MPPTQHDKLRPAVLAFLRSFAARDVAPAAAPRVSLGALRAAGIPLALAPLARGTHVARLGEGSDPDPRIKPRRRVGGWGDGGRRAAKLSSAPALLFLACAACTPGGAPAPEPEHPDAPRCGCPEPIALRPCDDEDRGDDAVIATAACEQPDCPGCRLAVAKLVSGDYTIELDVPACQTNAGRTCCALPTGQRVRIVHRGGFTANSDAPTPATDLCALPTVPDACAIPPLAALEDWLASIENALSAPGCLSEVGCPDPAAIPACAPELPSKCGRPLTSTDLALAPTGASVVVRGLLERGDASITLMACPPLLCCNRAQAPIAFTTGQIPLGDRWTCRGDESAICCPLALPDDPIPVLALGQLVELELPRQGRVFEPRALCRLPK